MEGTEGALGVTFEKEGAKFNCPPPPKQMFFFLLCSPFLLYKKMTSPFLLLPPEFWEVQLLERMPLLFLDKVSMGLFLREKWGEEEREDGCLERVQDTRQAEGFEASGV